MQLLDEVRSAWGWVGIEPVDLIDDNDFGNLIVKDVHGQYWRICPEDLYCEVLASSREELDRLAKDQEFLSDWYMRALVDEAFQRLGALPGKSTASKSLAYLEATMVGIISGRYRSTNSSEPPAILLSRLPTLRIARRSSYPLTINACWAPSAKVRNGATMACQADHDFSQRHHAKLARPADNGRKRSFATGPHWPRSVIRSVV